MPLQTPLYGIKIQTSILRRPLKMSIVCFDPSLLCSITSTFSSRVRFKFPANSHPTVDFGGKARLSSLTTPDDDYSNENHICASYGRRTLTFMPAISFVFPLLTTEIFGAIAADELFLIQGEVKKVMSKVKAAGILRLVFHDTGTFEMDENSGGMNGSIVYELDRLENGGLKKPIKILEKAKTEVDMIRPVSWADMIAVAGAEAVSVCGGPKIPVQLGRIDSMEPDPEGKLPAESLDAISLKQCFQRKGFTTQELVALSGAHTLGSKGFGNPTAFDNYYFKILLDKPWLSSAGMTGMIGLPTDRALSEDDECLRWITKYANDENLFFEDFKNAYIKLVNSGARWR